MPDLPDKLASAKEGSRELDAEIYHFLYKSAYPDETPEQHRKYARMAAPQYTASLDAIVSLIGEKLPGWDWDIGSDGYAYLSPNNGEVGITAQTATPALALCIVLLRALQKGNGHE